MALPSDYQHRLDIAVQKGEITEEQRAAEIQGRTHDGAGAVRLNIEKPNKAGVIIKNVLYCAHGEYSTQKYGAAESE